uniref:hypothetical protein n=1 Tax=Immundisolibacter sp. TaxID=1934948 RepID=UPI003565957B
RTASPPLGLFVSHTTNMSAYIAIASSLFGIVVGALLQSYFNRRNQKDTRLDEWRNSAYADFLNAVSAVATAQRHGKRDVVAEQLARLSDAKARICVYGDTNVIHSIAEFWRHGATLQTESEILAFTRVCLAIRASAGAAGEIHSPDISQLLFSIDVRDTQTPKSTAS